MHNLINHIKHDDCRGVVRSVDGTLHYFMHSGVVDLFRLVTTNPAAVCGGMIADRVIGRGAALLLVKGNISKVYALTISKSALEVFTKRGIDVEYEMLVDYIINRTGTGMCPVEQATLNIDNPNVAIEKIHEFLISKNILNNQ